MAYDPRWERLPDAIERVKALAGSSKEEAQTDIGRAIADGAIKIRAKLGRHTTNGFVSNNTVLEGKCFQIPPDIRPDDLDWEKSRPVKPWLVRRGHHAVHGYWRLEWIELHKQDVTTSLCSTPQRVEVVSRSVVSRSVVSRSRPALERARRALRELFPQGAPDQAALPNALLCRRVGEKLKSSGFADVSEDTILRAAGRRK